MPAPYSTNITDSGFLGIFELVNSNTEGYFFPVIIMIIWVITFVATKQFSSAKAFTYASFLGMILSIILSVIDLMSPRWMYLMIVLTAMGAVWLKFEEA